MENARYNLVFHFEVGRRASFSPRPYVKGSVFRDAVFFSKGSVFGLLKQLLILKEC